MTPGTQAQESREGRVLNIFDHAVFYDGYNGNIFDAELEDGILRHANHLYAKRLDDADLDWVGNDLQLRVTLGALCDNYDRIGNLTIAFVPKGQESYVPEEVQRIEVGRFITPFMNMNREPNEVPYEFRDDALSLILRDTKLRDQYDYWMEFELFGVPYAANTQIYGCADRNDVFSGTLDLVSESDPAEPVDNHVLVPIVMKRPESKGHNLNNYSEAGTDTIGTCTKTYQFNVPEDMADARLTLITSNHGANEGGEEYVRRKHLIYVDGELAYVYTPGGKSCEPYRQYNTMPNFIYGYGKKKDSWWEDWSNWCPGDVIPARSVDLGAFAAGPHEVMIRVPDAKFNGKQGDFPVSMYVQGVTDGQLPAGLSVIGTDPVAVDFRITDKQLTVISDTQIAEVEVYDLQGELCFGTNRAGAPINLASLRSGIYLIVATVADGRMAHAKVTI